MPNDNHDPKTGEFASGHGEPRQHPNASANAHEVRESLKSTVPSGVPQSAHQQFIASGKSESEWDKYAAEQNAASRQRAAAAAAAGTPSINTQMQEHLGALSPMQRAKAESALTAKVLVNGKNFMSRSQLVEQQVSQGATVQKTKRGEVLMHPSGAFLDKRNMTQRGLDYARFLVAKK
jgi:hypothetical protein